MGITFGKPVAGGRPLNRSTAVSQATGAPGQLPPMDGKFDAPIFVPRDHKSLAERPRAALRPTGLGKMLLDKRDLKPKELADWLRKMLLSIATPSARYAQLAPAVGALLVRFRSEKVVQAVFADAVGVFIRSAEAGTPRKGPGGVVQIESSLIIPSLFDFSDGESSRTSWISMAMVLNVATSRHASDSAASTQERGRVFIAQFLRVTAYSKVPLDRAENFVEWASEDVLDQVFEVGRRQMSASPRPDPAAEDAAHVLKLLWCLAGSCANPEALREDLVKDLETCATTVSVERRIALFMAHHGLVFPRLAEAAGDVATRALQDLNSTKGSSPHDQDAKSVRSPVKVHTKDPPVTPSTMSRSSPPN